MSTPRSVTLLTTDFRPLMGGVADHLHRLANALAKRMPVSVMTSVCRGDTEWEHAYDLVALPPLPDRRLDDRVGDRVAPIRKLHTGAYFLALRRYAARTIALRARDGPILIGIWDTASHFWCEECRRRDLPYHLFAHGVDMLVPLYGRLPEWRARDMTGAVRVIACSRATASLASDRFALATAPAVVHPSAGAPPPREAVVRRASELRGELGLADGPVVLSVGRLVPRKGFDRVLDGVAELRATWPSLQYIVVGDGPERARLEVQARERGVTGAVHFLGAVDELTKWAAYDVCDVFAMPNRVLGGSDWEGFGIVFLEAAVARRAAIGGNTGGVPDAVVDGVTGLLVDPEDANGFTGSLRRLLEDGALRARLGEHAAAWAARERSADASVDALYTSLGWN